MDGGDGGAAGAGAGGAGAQPEAVESRPGGVVGRGACRSPMPFAVDSWWVRALRSGVQGLGFGSLGVQGFRVSGRSRKKRERKKADSRGFGQVEKLLETKTEYERFVRRREKMVRKEGRRFARPVVAAGDVGGGEGGGGGGMEDEVGREVGLVWFAFPLMVVRGSFR